MAMVSLLGTPSGEQPSAEEAPHTHGVEMFLAVEATHGSQPAHLDASSLRHLLSCSACLAHSRTAGHAPQAGENSIQPPAVEPRIWAQCDVAAGPCLRREPARAPPSIA
jgi:hypothetical protein